MKLDPALTEIVSIDGEMAIIIRLGRRASDPIPALDRIKRSFRIIPGDVDTVGPFLEQTTLVKHGARTRASKLYACYGDWCELTGSKRISLPAFKRAMTARGFKQKISNGHWWLNLAMKDAGEGLLL